MNIEITTKKEFEKSINELYQKLHQKFVEDFNKEIIKIKERLNDIEIILQDRLK